MSVFFRLQATSFSFFFFFFFFFFFSFFFFFFSKASISVKNYGKFGVRLKEECFPATNSKDLDFSLKLGQYQKRNIVGR